MHPLLRSLSLLACAPTVLCIAAHSQPARKPAPRPAQHAAGPLPTGPTAVIDTTLGRITCRLYEKEKPATTANFIALAEGAKDWQDAESGAPVHGKPFYDANALFGRGSGIATPSRAAGNQHPAIPDFPAEPLPSLQFDQPGRLAMFVTKGQINSAFFILDHANEELKNQAAGIFGQCDAASLKVIEDISHRMLTADNRPPFTIAINHIAIVRPGEPFPAVAPDVPVASITPQLMPPPPSIVPVPEPTGPTAVIETTMGTLTCRLFTKEAPIGAATFLGLAQGTKAYTDPTTHKLVSGKHFYDGLTFGRVIPDFMIQNADRPGDPGGGADIGFHFDNEVLPGLDFDRPGRLAFANAGPSTNDSEFFVTEHPVSRLNGNYTIFGQCDDASVKVVEAIARVPRDAKNKPLKPVVIRRVTVQPG